MADGMTSIRHLRHESDTAAHVDALVQQRLTLAHESRRRRARAPRARKPKTDTSRSAR